MLLRENKRFMPCMGLSLLNFGLSASKETSNLVCAKVAITAASTVAINGKATDRASAITDCSLSSVPMALAPPVGTLPVSPMQYRIRPVIASAIIGSPKRSAA